MRYLALLVLAALAWVARPKVTRGVGFGDENYDYVKVEFRRCGFEFEWWQK